MAHEIQTAAGERNARDCIFTSACENLTPGENAAVFGTAAGLATGIPLVASGVNPNIAIPMTAGAVAAAAVGAYIIAKHQATERQRKNR